MVVCRHRTELIPLVKNLALVNICKTGTDNQRTRLLLPGGNITSSMNRSSNIVIAISTSCRDVCRGGGNVRKQAAEQAGKQDSI